jgi:hypothetical protein
MYHSTEVQGLATSHNFGIRVIKRKKIKRWAKKLMDLVQALWETVWIKF